MTADPQAKTGPIARIWARRGYCLWLAAGRFLLLFLAFRGMKTANEAMARRPPEGRL